jgi:hypothetical protein
MTLPADDDAIEELADLGFDRIRPLVNRLFLAIFVVLVAIVIVILALRYFEASGEGRRSAENLADVLSASVAIRLGAIDGALTRVAIGNHRLGGVEGAEREWGEMLRAATLGVSGLSSVVVIGTDGIVKHSSLQLIVGHSWADQPVFKELAKGNPNQLVVDRPITMVVGSNVLVPFGRALTDPRGNFIGAAVATLIPNQLEDFLATFDLGTSGVAWILLPTGEALFRAGPETDSGAQDASEAPLFARDGLIEEDGFASGSLASDGAQYLTAYRNTGFGGLVVAVSLAESDYIGRWLYEALGGSILIIIAGAGLFLGSRRINDVVLESLETAHAGETVN